MYETGKLVQLNINDILPNRFQPRIYFNDTKLYQLAQSISKYGIIQPIVVRQINNKYEIIAGERRYKASKLANKATIPAVVINLTDRESEEIALLENIQRQALTPIEEAVSYKRILDGGYISKEELAKKIGKDEKFISEKVKLLSLDDTVQDALLGGKISERHARSLLKLKSREVQREMLSRIINERLTVKRTDDEIAKILNNTIKNNSVELLFDGKENFMDIDRTLKEAQDINAAVSTPTEQNPAATVFNNMNNMQNNETENAQTNQTSDGNKFVHFVPNETSKIEPAASTPTFDNIFNQSINNQSTENTQTPVLETPTQSATSSTFDNNMQNTPNINEFSPSVSEPSTINQSNTTDTPIQTIGGLDTNNNIPNIEPNQVSNIEPSNVNQTPVVENTPINKVPDNIPVTQSTDIPPVNNINTFDMQVNNSTNTTPDNNTTTYDTSNINPAESSPIQEQPNTFNNQVTEPINLTSNQDYKLPTQNSIANAVSEAFAKQENQSNNISNIPQADIIEENAIPNIPIANSINTPNIKEAIRLIRECADKIEALGYTLNVDEADLNDKYQVTFNINK